MTGRTARITNRRTPGELCDQGNQIIAAIGRTDIHWVIRGGRVVIEWAHEPVNGFDENAKRCGGE
jgi:hypothetical protein